MNKLILKPTKTNPYICFDPNMMHYEISGKSYPEDPMEVFSPVFSWVENNICLLNHKMELHLQTDYFNSASNRMLLKLFRILEVELQNGKDIEIIWRFEDEEIQNDGVVFSKLVSIPFTFVHHPVIDI